MTKKIYNVRMVVSAAMLLAILLCGNSCLQAQTTTGAVAGLVGSATGSPVPGALVTLMSVATGQVQTTQTGEDGRYGFPSVEPGTYRLTFSREGFQTTQMQSVAVNVAENTGVDAQLQPGRETEQVACVCTVTHEASSASGELVDSKEITAVPLTSRNVTQVIATTAGASADSNNAGLLGNRNQNVTVNGNANGGNFTVDGMTSSVAPNPDAITQFRIQTSQYDSGYGAKVPTNNISTKGGSNDIHGALWEFVRNDVFNANAFFLKRDGQPRANLKQNQYGGAVGGPLVKNKLFYFVSYQGTRQINGLDPTSLSTLDLPPLTNDRSAAKLGSQFCPTNHPGDNRYNTFAGGTQVACDGSNINPIALKILNLKLPDGTFVLPTPQQITSEGLGRSSYSRPSYWNDGQYIYNMDYVLTKKHTISGRVFFDRLDQKRSFGAPGNGSDTVVPPGNPQFFQQQNFVTSVKLTSVLTSNLVNDFRVALNANHSTGTGPLYLATSLGMIAADPLLDEAPELTIQGSLGGVRLLGSQGNESKTNARTYQVTDNVSWIYGRHSFRTGFHYSNSEDEHFDYGPARGRMTFQNFTDFLLGMSATQNGSPSGLSNVDSVAANEGSGAKGDDHNRNHSNSFSAFVQDDIKLHPRLTLNLGVRWEYLMAPFDPLGQYTTIWPDLIGQVPIPPASGTYIGYTVAANYDPTTINPYTNTPFGPVPTGVIVRPSNSLFQNSPSVANLAPRFGFAWQPGGKQKRVALRGGYGWFYQAAGGGMSPPSPPFNQTINLSSSNNGASTLQKPFPTATLGFVLRTPASRLSDRIGGPEYKLPLVQQWNLTAQLTLIGGTSMDIGYVGSYGIRSGVNSNSNQPLLASPGHPVNCGLPTTPAGLGVDAVTFAKLGIDSNGCVTVNNSDNAKFRVPIIGEAVTALSYDRPIGHTKYNALQATFRKQPSHGFGFNVSYTFSKNMSDTSRFNNNDLPLYWSRTGGDRTQRLTINYNYQFPRFGTTGLKAFLLNGWLMSGVTSLQSGQPLTLIDRSAGSLYGRSSTSTITMCPGKTYDDLVTPGSTGQRLEGWINKSAICSRTDGNFGTAGQGIITGPGQNNWDLSIGKVTRVGGVHEDSQLEFRAEFYNALNHPQFSNPGTTSGTSSFGRITQTAVAPRLIQFGVKYLF